MIRTSLVDTGPLISLIDQREQHHLWVRLVRMSELVPDGVVFTLDSDFHIYRRHGRQKISLLMPPNAKER